MNATENEITYRPVTEQPDLSNFSCGKRTIDDHIREAWQIVAERRSIVLEILIDGYLVGFMSYKINPYPSTPIDWDDEDYVSSYDYGAEEYYYAIHLEYLALNEPFQSKKIGTAALNWFINLAKTRMPVRYITLEATPDNISWYKKNGFSETESTDVGNVFMYRDLRDVETLEEIVCQME